MITAKMTYHASYERADRLAFIAEHIGVGNILYRFPDKRNPAHCNCITSTGVLIITVTNTNEIITAYLPDKDKFYAIFRGAGYGHIPETIMRKCYENRRIIKKMGLTF
jgi:hypothetical protein